MRVIAGLVSAVPGNIVGGSIEDLFNSKERIWAIYWWTTASNVGLILGPIMSSHLVAYLNW
jgi:MFS family permease